MKTADIIEKLISNLKEKEKAFIGNLKDDKTMAESKGFKNGLAWAIESVETVKEELITVTDNKQQIINLLYEVIKNLGGKSDILSVVGSCGDGDTDLDTIEQIQFLLKNEYTQQPTEKTRELRDDFYRKYCPPTNHLKTDKEKEEYIRDFGRQLDALIQSGYIQSDSVDADWKESFDKWWKKEFGVPFGEGGDWDKLAKNAYKDGFNDGLSSKVKPVNNDDGWISIDKEKPKLTKHYEVLSASGYILWYNDGFQYVGWFEEFTQDSDTIKKGEMFFNAPGTIKTPASKCKWQPLPKSPR